MQLVVVAINTLGHKFQLNASEIFQRAPSYLGGHAKAPRALGDASLLVSSNGRIFFFTFGTKERQFCKLFVTLPLVFQMSNFAQKLLYSYTNLN